MGVEVIPAPDLTRSQIRTLQKHTMGQKDGEMYDAILDWCHTPTAKVLRIKERGRIIGWALIHPYDLDRWDVQLYVDKQHRRKGYGRALMTKALDIVGDQTKTVVHKHSHESIAFFESFGYHNGMKLTKEKV